MRVVKLLIWTIIAVGGLYPAYPLVMGDSTVLADPAKYLLEYYGKTATLFLIAVLSLSPLQTLFPKAAIVRNFNRHRRLIGVGAFFFALTHLCFYAVYTGGLSGFFEDIGKPFILSGVTAFAILFVLAVTSANRVIRRLGGKNWKRLHRLVYGAAVLLVFHQALQEKAGAVQTVYFFAPLAVLQILRIGRTYFQPKKA